jgi:hypothetical protein
MHRNSALKKAHATLFYTLSTLFYLAPPSDVSKHLTIVVRGAFCEIIGANDGGFTNYYYIC